MSRRSSINKVNKKNESLPPNCIYPAVQRMLLIDSIYLTLLHRYPGHRREPTLGDNCIGLYISQYKEKEEMLNADKCAMISVPCGVNGNCFLPNVMVRKKTKIPL